jgi:hypothetical protein
MTAFMLNSRYDDVKKRVDQAIPHKGLMDEASHNFLLDMRARLLRYGERTFVSVKQLNWITHIEAEIAKHTAG